MSIYLKEDKSDIMLHYKLREYADKMSGRHNDFKANLAKDKADASNNSSLRNTLAKVDGLKNDTNLKKDTDERNQKCTDYINSKLRIEESFNNGIITESVKDNLLILLNEAAKEDKNQDKSKERRKVIRRLTIIILGIGATITILYALKQKNENDKKSNIEYDKFIKECNLLMKKVSDLKTDIIENKPTDYKNIDKQIDQIMNSDITSLKDKINNVNSISPEDKTRLNGKLLHILTMASSARNANWKNEDDNI